MSEYTPTKEDVGAVARVLAAIESRKPAWGFSLDEAVVYRVEKWRRHTNEAEQLLDELKPWLAEVKAEAWDRCLDEIEKYELNTAQAREGNPYREGRGDE